MIVLEQQHERLPNFSSNSTPLLRILPTGTEIPAKPMVSPKHLDTTPGTTGQLVDVRSTRTKGGVDTLRGSYSRDSCEGLNPFTHQNSASQSVVSDQLQLLWPGHGPGTFPANINATQTVQRGQGLLTSTLTSMGLPTADAFELTSAAESVPRRYCI